MNDDCKSISNYVGTCSRMGNFPVCVLYVYLLFYFFFLSLSNRSWCATIIFGCCTIFLCILLFLVTRKRESGRNRYECLIDDTASFTEVAENYDIVGQRGNLWILEDKVEK